jgi:hypothetical protein
MMGCISILNAGIGRTGSWTGSICLALSFALCAAGGSEPSNAKAPDGDPSLNLVRTYAVKRKVADFPTNEDLSTLE